MIKLTDSQWNKIKNKYVPEDIRKEIERDNFIATIKGEKTTIPIKKFNGEYEKTPAEKLSEYWFITPSPNSTGKRQFSLTHKEGVALIQGVKSRKAVLILWDKLSKFDMEHDVATLYKKLYANDIAQAVTEFKNTGE